MPTISFSLKDLQNLVGKKLTIGEVENLAHYGKGDFDGYDKKTDEVRIDFGDTNLPYLWSVEGFSRLIKGIEGKQRGIPKIKLNKSEYNIFVDSSVSKIRPYISGFIAKGHKIDDYLLRQIIQLQEKLSENYGRRRQKISIGVYSYDKITFPVYYKSASPDSVSFEPLGFKEKMSLREILKNHPKGIEYSCILKDFDKYPILADSKEEILSFVPIINSNFTGKLEEGDENIMVEVTGTDIEHVSLASNIFCYALFERGFQIYPIGIKYRDRKPALPELKNKQYSIIKNGITKLFGLELADSEIKTILEKAQYNVLEIDRNKIKLEIPSYRNDILHQNDVIEDIGIFYGFENIQESPLSSFTIGSVLKLNDFVDKVREILIGANYQEILSPMLSNKSSLYDKMNIKDFGTVEIDEFMSETYSVVRSWILPDLMNVFSRNKHVSYPQRIFEEGTVNTRKEDKIFDFNRVAAASSH